ncbi:MAG: AAA family ATPase [Gammaproteobacteria bacterium]|nr:AAA family ATPase [Gammaproteobacteria bacterium]
MLSAYIRHLILTYLANVLGRVDRRQPQASAAIEWIGDNCALLELDGDEFDWSSHAKPDLPSEKDWRRLRRLVGKGCQATKVARPDRASVRLAHLKEMIGLTDEDMAILELLLRYETHPVFEDMVDSVFAGRRHYRLGNAMNLRHAGLPALLGLPPSVVRPRFGPTAPLTRSGLVKVEDDQDVSCVDRLQRLASVVDDQAGVRELLLGTTRPSDLDWSDFDHLGTGRDHVERMLRGALERGTRGVNTLVYGPPGTGKTEFCHVLAHRIGVDLFSVGEADEQGDEPSRRERLAELRLAQSLLGDDRGALLLFDEMEDLLSQGLYAMPFERFVGRHGGAASKVFMHRLLEETPAPTVWTTNSPAMIDKTILRRMMFALEMRQPPPRIRARIWSRQLARHGIDATETQASALAHEFEATPGIAAGATKAADLAGGDYAAVRRGVRSLSRLLGCERPKAKPSVDFEPALIGADVDVEHLAARLVADKQKRFSLCLQGPPGTGKTAYVRYLAHRIGLEVLQKRTSDLLDMWVGSSERNIADAFAEARDNQAFLVFDEADSLLADRRGAHRSWEVSQVNEMLTWMESHPLPFACTTNFGESLDAASLRRFVFKVTLRFLKPGAASLAFKTFFGLEPPEGLRTLRSLTPGDFEVVRRKADMLGQLEDGDALVAMLRDECAAKPGRPVAIGFAP